MQLPSYLTALLLLLPSFPTNSTAPLDPPLPLVAPIASPHPHYLSSPHAFNPHPHGHVPPKHAHKHARHALSPARLHARGQTWVSQGCVSDGPARALPAYFAQLDHLSIAVCTSACAAAGYTYAGLEYGQECHCDNALQNGLGTPIDPGNCNMACDGDGAENCGGSYAMELYHLQDAAAGGAGWSSVGCAVDSANRVLAGTSTSDSNGMTLESCESFCKGYAYMGVENGDECYCGNTLVGGFVSGGGCSTPCAGNGQETCGGGWRLSVYSSGSPSPTSTSTSTSTSPTSTSAPPATSGWVSLGCVSDGPARALPAYFAQLDDLTVASCTARCSAAGYTYAGLEYGQECHCDNSLQNGLGTALAAGSCNMACDGDATELCGGNYAMNLWQLKAGTSTSTSTSSSASTRASTTTTSSTSTSTSTSAAATSSSWVSLGCVSDGPARALPAYFAQLDDLTVASCTARCSAAGYTYAGLEYAQECHCDNSLQNGLGTALAAGSCNMACDGDATELCGGNYAMNLWQLKAGSGTSTSTRTSTSTSSSAAPTSSAWVSLGCVTDGQARALPAYFAQLSDNSVELCTAKCAAAGYTYAGVEYGQECHCDNSLQNGLGVATSASSCNMACDGNAKEICGGNLAMNLYQLKAGPSTTTSTAASATATAGWNALGCAVDSSSRVLAGPSTSDSSGMTLEKCGAYCKGYTYMGVENGDECYCGNTMAGGFVSGTGCTTACAGNSAELCGGGWRLNIYSYGASSTSTSTSSSASATSTTGPQIWDIWYTSNDQSTLFQRAALSNPITFTTPGSIGQADIIVSDNQLYQDMDGFGVSLPDSSASMLANLKSANSNNYWQLLHTLFDTTDGAATAGLSIIRVPLGASDFSPNVYSFHDNYDPNLGSFNINAAPSYLWSTLADIVSVNPSIKIMVAPWSPPGWMKDSGSMLGGTFQGSYVSTLAAYLLKCVQGFQSKGFTVSHLAIQNEPENSNPTYPTCLMNASDGANVAAQLRSLLNNNGFGNLKIMAWEHNWDQAANYPVQELQDQNNAFAGASFHCYAGSVDQQMSFYNAFPNKEVHFTECIGTFGSDWWSDIKWDMSNLMIGAPSYMSRSVVMWAVALDGGGNPKLPGTDSCGGPGCRPIATVNYDGTYSLNQEFYSLAHGSRAVVPKDSGGPFGQRIGSSINGNLNYELVVSAYKTGRSAAANTNWNRYSLVVVNWNDQSGGGPVTTTIEFRGMQATYSFPIGVTTLWWFAEN